jgi:diamine N-acetyltransferase
LQGLGSSTGAPVVRQAGRRDARRLSEFFVRAWKESGAGALGFTGANDSAIGEISSEEFLKKRLGSPAARLFVATRGGTVVGFASVRRVDQKTAELTGIVVLRGETGRGLGTRLLRKVEASAAGQGSDRLVARTEEFNQRAISFFRKNGFSQVRSETERVGRTRAPLAAFEERLKRPQRPARSGP